MHDVSTIHDAFCGATQRQWQSSTHVLIHIYIYIRMHTAGKAVSFEPSHNKIPSGIYIIHNICVELNKSRYNVLLMIRAFYARRKS